MTTTTAPAGTVIVQQPSSHRTFIKALYSDRELKCLCLPIAMDIRDIEKVDAIVQRCTPFHAGDHLYRSGDIFHSVYAVRSGSIKTYLIDDEGVEQVTGFYLPGEVFGFDGLGTHQHACNVVAMETSAVHEIKFDRLEELMRHLPILQHHLFQLMGNQIVSGHQMMATLSKKNAEGRIATLLISLSTRYGRRHLSPNAMRLPMSRMDIGNYLGLAIETVSRTFSRLHREGILNVDGREVLIKDHARLGALCHAHG